MQSPPRDAPRIPTRPIPIPITTRGSSSRTSEWSSLRDRQGRWCPQGGRSIRRRATDQVVRASAPVRYKLLVRHIPSSVQDHQSVTALPGRPTTIGRPGFLFAFAYNAAQVLAAPRSAQPRARWSRPPLSKRYASPRHPQVPATAAVGCRTRSRVAHLVSARAQGPAFCLPSLDNGARL
jgi:hypothetical protein